MDGRNRFMDRGGGHTRAGVATSKPGRGVNPSLPKPKSIDRSIDRSKPARTEVVSRQQGRLHRVLTRGGAAAGRRCHGVDRAGVGGGRVRRVAVKSSNRARDSASVASIGARASACGDGWKVETRGQAVDRAGRQEMCGGIQTHTIEDSATSVVR